MITVTLPLPLPPPRQRLLVLVLVLVGACSQKAETVRSSQEVAKTAAAEAPPQREPVTACAMVTPAEMSKILGTTVTAEPHEGTVDQTECIYKATSGISPYVDFTVVRGDGEVAMTASGFMAQQKPNMVNPYEGIGDQAFAVGPALMIRTGEDLVKLILSGVTDAPPKAKLIFNTAKPRM